MTTAVPAILAVIGAITALAGMAALMPPRWLAFRLPLTPLSAAGWFFLRHWGILVALCGTALVAAAIIPTWREPIILLVAVEKFCFATLALTQRDQDLRRALRPGALADLVATGALAACWFNL